MDAELREILMNMQNSILGIGVKLDRIENRLDRIEERMDRLEERMDRLEERMNRLEERMDRLEGRMDRLEGRMDQLEGRMDQLEERVFRLEEQMDCVHYQITSLESVVKETRIILEHETNRKITALFDGREDELRYRDLIIIHDKEIRNIKPRLNNIEISYGRHLAEYHPS